MAIFTFNCLSNLYFLRHNINVALPFIVDSLDNIHMTESSNMCLDEVELDRANMTTPAPKTMDDRLQWNPKVIELQITLFHVGYFVTHIPGGVVCDRIGGKILLMFGLFCSSLFSLLMPLSVVLGPQTFLMLQFFNGLVTGPIFPAVTSIYARWVPSLERGMFAAMVFGGIIVGDLEVTSIGLYILKKTKWQYLFYISGFFGMLTVGATYIWIFSSPHEHPFVSQHEKDHLERTIEGITPTKDLKPIPWIKLFRCSYFWALLVCQFGHNWSKYIKEHEEVAYMEGLVRQSPQKMGVLAALPFLCEWIVALLGGFIGDLLIKIEAVTLSMNRKILVAISSFVPAVSFLLVSYQGCSKLRVTICYSIGIVSMGLFHPGLKASVVDLSPNYAGTIMALVNGAGQLVSIISPSITNAITTDNTLSEWRFVFWTAFTIICFTCIFFLNFGGHRIQKWNNPIDGIGMQ